MEENNPGSVLPAFRLWVTAEPHPEFPIGMLQLSIKFTNEAPAGIMLGVRNTYTWLNQDMLDSVTDPKWKTMLFAPAFMHTIVQVQGRLPAQAPPLVDAHPLVFVCRSGASS